MTGQLSWGSQLTKDCQPSDCTEEHYVSLLGMEHMSVELRNKANLRDLIAATGLVILLKFDPNHRFFVPCDLEIWWMALENNRAPLLYYIKLCASFQIHRWIQIGISPETLNLGQNRQFFFPCDLEIWQMTSKNNRAPLLCCFKLCVSFHSHQWIQTGVTVRKRPILVKIDDFFSRVTLKFNGWPSKTIGHLFFATSTFVHHFIPIGSVAVNYRYRRYKSI